MDLRESSWQDFYLAFENRFRGSSAGLISTLQERYGERLRQLASANANAKAADLGCGRGEFLEVLKKCGFHPTGVDESPAMLKSSAFANEFLVVSDLLVYLKKSPGESLAFISLMHVIEHCPPPYILEVFKQAARVLKPGGAFLVETPSILSLWAGVRQFYLDPTHQRPVHPEYICFLAEFCGFAEATQLEFAPVVHPEKPDLSQIPLTDSARNEATKLMKMLYGPSDVAVWAVK